MVLGLQCWKGLLNFLGLPLRVDSAEEEWSLGLHELSLWLLWNQMKYKKQLEQVLVWV